VKGLHWWTLLIGYLAGSFFGLMNVLGFAGGLFGGKKSAPAAA
jgi:hypothetical protein